VVSAAGAGLQTRIGVGVLILFTAPNLWAVAEEAAAKHGQTVRREEWRLVLPVHLAETRDAAIHALRLGAGRFNREYLGDPRTAPGVRRPGSNPAPGPLGASPYSCLNAVRDP
jgi:hypothetical protein